VKSDAVILEYVLVWPLGHKPTNAPTIMTFVKLFFYAGKTLYWVVLGVFHGDLDFFISKLSLVALGTI